LILILVVAAGMATAQVLYGSLTGIVTDPSGALVSGSEVRTGVSQQATTDASGIYRFTYLLPGTYKLTISAAGFAAQETSGVRVTGNEVSRVNGQLKVESASQNAFGVTNTPHFNNPNANFSSLSTFGTITSTLVTRNASLGGSGGQRQWWFGGKLIF
jgi:Carboxypeptidase regulatory-like domain